MSWISEGNWWNFLFSRRKSTMSDSYSSKESFYITPTVPLNKRTLSYHISWFEIGFQRTKRFAKNCEKKRKFSFIFRKLFYEISYFFAKWMKRKMQIRSENLAFRDNIIAKKNLYASFFSKFSLFDDLFCKILHYFFRERDWSENFDNIFLRKKRTFHETIFLFRWKPIVL